MLRRILILGVVFSALAMAPRAFADTELGLCTSNPPPCVVSVERDGAPIPYNQVLDIGEDIVIASRYHIPGDPTRRYTFSITNEHGEHSLSPSSTYEMVLNLGPDVAGETFARGSNVMVERAVDGSGNHIVTFTLDPVRMADRGCDASGDCRETARRLFGGYLEGWIDDLAFLSDPDDAAAMRGFDLASNAEYVSSPLELDFATNSIVLRVANAHYEPGGSTVFQGLAKFKLPFPMLRRLYHVDDPASLGPGAFSVTGAGGASTTTVEVDPGGQTVRVDIDGITFSKKRLTITGDTRPTRPRNVTADRVAPRRGKIRFDPADSRGSRVREYRAYCRHQSGAGDFFSFREDEGSPLVLRGLKPGLRYECTVRARSRAGFGPAARVTMPRFP